MLPVDNKVKIGLEKLKDGLKKFMSFVQIHFLWALTHHMLYAYLLWKYKIKSSNFNGKRSHCAIKNFLKDK